MDVDFFRTMKNVGVHEAFGIKGEAIVLRLLCAIYQNGCYALWSPTLAADIANDIPGGKPTLVADVVNYLVRKAYFDPATFASKSMLTSAEIQTNHIHMCQRYGRRITPCPCPLVTWPAKKSASKPITPNPCTPPDPPPPKLIVQPLAESYDYGLSNPENSETLTEAIAALRRDTPWMNSLTQLFHLDQQQILELLTSFELSCSARGYSTRGRGEVKRHFTNWIQKHIQYESQRNNQTTTIDEQQFRRSIIARIQSPDRQDGFADSTLW